MAEDGEMFYSVFAIKQFRERRQSLRLKREHFLDACQNHKREEDNESED